MRGFLALLQLDTPCSADTRGRSAPSQTQMKEERIGAWKQSGWGLGGEKGGESVAYIQNKLINLLRIIL